MEQLKNINLEELLVILETIHAPVCVSDPDTYEILFTNKTFETILGRNVVGERCYQALQNLDAPCPFCTNPYLFGPDAEDNPISWNHRNRLINKWFHCTDMAITWEDGRKVRLEIAEEMSTSPHEEFDDRMQSHFRFLDVLQNLEDVLQKPDVPVSGKLKNVASLLRRTLAEHYDRIAIRLTLFGKDFVSGPFTSPIYTQKILAGLEKEYVGELEIGGPLSITGKNLRSLHPEDVVFLETVAMKIGSFVETLTQVDKLREVQERYDLATQAAGVGIWDWYPPAKNIYFSKQWKQQLGYSDRDLPNLVATWEKLLHPEDKKGFHDEIQKYLKQPDGIFVATYRLKHKDGSYRWIRNRAACSKDPEGKVFRIFGIHQDITDQIQMEGKMRESTRFLNNILDLSPDLIYIYDLEEQRNILATKEITSLLGYSQSQIQALGENLLKSLAHPDDYGRILKHHQKLRNYKTNRTATLKYRMKNAEGKWVWLLSRDKPFRRNSKGQVKQILGNCRDITWEHETGERLKKLNRALELSNRELEQVLYTTSHDLRSPLLNIEGFSSMQIKLWNQLKDNLAKTRETDTSIITKIHEADKEFREASDFIHSSIKKMDKMIHALLLVSRAGRTQLRPEVIDMDTLIREILEEHQWYIREHNIQVSIAPLLPCLADRKLIYKSFENLIGNALKYLNPDKPGKVRISAREAGDFVEYRVLDNGIGISTREMDKIFNLFYQSDPAREGTGIGLSLVKNIIDRHGGTIRVHSTPDKGTRFSIFLPVAKKKT